MSNWVKCDAEGCTTEVEVGQHFAQPPAEGWSTITVWTRTLTQDQVANLQPRLPVPPGDRFSAERRATLCPAHTAVPKLKPETLASDPYHLAT